METASRHVLTNSYWFYCNSIIPCDWKQLNYYELIISFWCDSIWWSSNSHWTLKSEWLHTSEGHQHSDYSNASWHNPMRCLKIEGISCLRRNVTGKGNKSLLDELNYEYFSVNGAKSAEKTHHSGRGTWMHGEWCTCNIRMNKNE